MLVGVMAGLLWWAMWDLLGDYIVTTDLGGEDADNRMQQTKVSNDASPGSGRKLK